MITDNNKEIKNINKDNAPLELAARLTELVEKEWANGKMLQAVTPTTAELLKYWFGEAFCELRDKNFHLGQRRAILNTIYLHEVAKEKKVIDAYSQVAQDLLQVADLEELASPKNAFPKYCVKMATGTGKTWVMHALIIWQALNALSEATPSGRFTKNFLIMAPGIIVYERLLDAFLGRVGEQQVRDIQTSDFVLNQELLLPPQYREQMLSFIQNNVVSKEDGIGNKVTGGGLIALANWHRFEKQLPEEDGDTKDATLPEEYHEIDAKKVITDIMPVIPGTTSGNALEALDRRNLSGNELEYLASLPDIMVINDEAHHIHSLKSGMEASEVKWQQALDYISKGKGERYVQLDFTATPYISCGTRKTKRGSGETKDIKHYFPHIIVDFNLNEALSLGLVKLLLLDERLELTDFSPLDYKAERAEKHVTGLSDGQRLMLRAGLTKLRYLENEFAKVDKNKHPKMLVACEDTEVSPFVEVFLIGEGLSQGDIVRIDSNKQGEVSQADWQEVKGKVFDIDHRANPKVIISVMMLREGFDVNNICVLVALRSAKSSILLEQLIGRGLRLMWRESAYQDIKRADRELVMKHHTAPTTRYDTLSIIEHPAFRKFYTDLINSGQAAVESDDPSATSPSATGDIINVGLREDYQPYDMEWPVILHDSEEEIQPLQIDISKLESFTLYPLDALRNFLATDGEIFVSQEITTQTRFGRYKVTADLFTAESYNEYLGKLVHIITNRMNGKRTFPTMQINEAEIAQSMDTYIRTRLFNQPFNPFNNNDWKILLSKNNIVTAHIIEQFSKEIYRAQQDTIKTLPDVALTKFSCVKTLTMRDKFSTEVSKCIYERQGWPTHGGGLEKDFMALLEQDGDVQKWLKIDESRHHFARIFYMRADGLMAFYHPDFLVATKDKVYLIETKGQDKVNDANVKQKQMAATEWVKKVNSLGDKRPMNREWTYVLVGEETFHRLRNGRAGVVDICAQCSISYATASGTLFE